MNALISPGELAEKLGAPELRVIEVKLAADGGAGAFAAGHVPGAAFSDYAGDGWRAKIGDAPGKVPSAAHLSALLGQLGVEPGHHVVLVPSGTSANDLAASARVYFTLKLVGHEKVSILDGGAAAWLSDPALPVAQEGSKVAPAAPYPLRWQADLRAEVPQVLAAIEAGRVLIDARATSYFEGREKAGEARVAGRLPGAINRDYAALFDPVRHGLKDKAALEAYFAGLPEGEAIAYCNTGHTAALDWFVLSEVLGRKTRLYDGSMTEWTEDASRPVETGAG
jgi:thiosulfate/3-mercaptopyruvate sulfurtransferase